VAWTTLHPPLRLTLPTAATTGALRGATLAIERIEDMEEWHNWRSDRAVSVALVPLTVIPFAAGSAIPLVDAGLISMLILHTYMGFQ
jgi:hypothetical protein